MYTIKRTGKTYDEYRAFILEKVQERELEAGDEAALLAQKYQENDEWFEKNQALFDNQERINNLDHFNMRIALAGYDQPNPALVKKQLLTGDEDLFTLLEAVTPQIEEFKAKELEKKNKRQSYKARKSEMKEWLQSVNFADWKAADTKKAIVYLMRLALDEQDNE